MQAVIKLKPTGVDGSKPHKTKSMNSKAQNNAPCSAAGCKTAQERPGKVSLKPKSDRTIGNKD